jgi:transcriptional regulator GlxA family with amidase domain
MTTPQNENPQEFGYLVLPQFSMLNLGAAMDPLRAANRLCGHKLYVWRAIAAEGLQISSSNGIDLTANATLAEIDRIANLIVVAGMEPKRYAEPATQARLRRLARGGCRLGAVSTGSYILAKAGLLDGYRCTIHWESLNSFREEFPKLEATQELYEIDRDRMTCSGGTAAMDMMLHLIALDHGRDLATAVAEQFIHGQIRDKRAPQRMALRNRLGAAHPKLLSVVELMEENLEDPLTRAELARRVGLSTRQLERLFRSYLRRTPTRYYLELRLQRARSLLTQSTMSVLDVAMACGFVSASHFSKCYRDYFNRTPREDRRYAI